jgi:hypothetical protein
MPAIGFLTNNSLILKLFGAILLFFSLNAPASASYCDRPEGVADGTVKYDSSKRKETSAEIIVPGGQAYKCTPEWSYKSGSTTTFVRNCGPFVIGRSQSVLTSCERRVLGRHYSLSTFVSRYRLRDSEGREFDLGTDDGRCVFGNSSHKQEITYTCLPAKQLVRVDERFRVGESSQYIWIRTVNESPLIKIAQPSW